MIKVESEYAETMDLRITVHGYNRNRSIDLLLFSLLLLLLLFF